MASGVNYTDWKVPADSGTYEINVTVSSVNLTSSMVWLVSCNPRPALKVVITNPYNNTAVKPGERVSFNAVAPTVPASEIPNFGFFWYLGDKKIGEGASFCTTALRVGNNTVECRVQNRTEPAQNGRASVVVFVGHKNAATDNAPGLLIAVAALAIAVAAGVGLMVVRRRRRPPAGEADAWVEDERAERHRRRAGRHGRKSRSARKEKRENR